MRVSMASVQTLVGRDIGIPDRHPRRHHPDCRTRVAGRSSGSAARQSPASLRVDVSDPHAPCACWPTTFPPPPDPFGVQRSAIRPDASTSAPTTACNSSRLAAQGYESHAFARAVMAWSTTNATPNAQFIDAHDRFWTGTLGGLSVFDPTHEVRDRHEQAAETHRPAHRRIALVDGDAACAFRPDSTICASTSHCCRGATKAPRRSARSFSATSQAPIAWSHRISAPLMRFRLATTCCTSKHATMPVISAHRWGVPIAIPAAMVAAAAWVRTAVWLPRHVLALPVRCSGARAATEAQRRDLRLRVAARTVELQEANARLLELSYKDALTGLANRRSLLEALEMPRMPTRPRRCRRH